MPVSLVTVMSKPVPVTLTEVAPVGRPAAGGPPRLDAEGNDAPVDGPMSGHEATVVIRGTPHHNEWSPPAPSAEHPT